MIGKSVVHDKKLDIVDMNWAVFSGTKIEAGITYADVLINGWTYSYKLENETLLDGLSRGDILFFTLNEDYRPG